MESNMHSRDFVGNVGEGSALYLVVFASTAIGG